MDLLQLLILSLAALSGACLPDLETVFFVTRNVSSYANCLRTTHRTKGQTLVQREMTLRALAREL